MHNYWDDPAGELIQGEKLYPLPFRRAASGLALPESKIDIKKIRETQRELLYPHFAELYHQSLEMLEHIDAMSKIGTESTVCYNVAYRKPDDPFLCQEIIYTQIGHAIALVEPSDRKMPAAVESVFPLKKTSDLSQEFQDALLEIIRTKPLARGLNLPPYVRTVMPKAAHYFMSWIDHNDGPIRDVKTFQIAHQVDRLERNHSPKYN